jgi:hypothetical protein
MACFLRGNISQMFRTVTSGFWRVTRHPSLSPSSVIRESGVKRGTGAAGEETIAR